MLNICLLVPVTVIVAIGVGACGGDSKHARTATTNSPAAGLTTNENSLTVKASALSAEVQAVRRCLRTAGVVTHGGSNPQLASAAPDAELVTTSATFIAFYRSASRAKQRAPELRQQARDYGGTITRHGPTTVLYTNEIGATEPDPHVEHCLR